MSPEDAEEYTGALGQVVAGGYRQVALGVRLGVPRALGLTTRDWVEGRLGGYVRLQMAERQNAVAELTDEGLSNRQIADVLGVDEGTIRNDLRNSPHPDEQDKAGAATDAENSADVKPTHVTQNSGTFEWYTPSSIIDAARAVLGDIDLDPASSAVANETIRATTFYTAVDNGLAKPWFGRIWMNPPYSTGLVDRFVNRLIDYAESGDVTAAVVLTNNATDTRWWQRLAAYAMAICFTAGRVRFLADDGERNTPLQGQTIVYLGEADTLFMEQFTKFGLVR